MASENTTILLERYRAGDPGALDLLMERLYDGLKAAARRQLARFRSGDTLNTTSLVHEAYLRLLDGQALNVSDRAHLLALASRSMRFVLVDHARSRSAEKRGGGAAHASLDQVNVGAEDTTMKVMEIDEALRRLESHDPRLGRVVELRFFGGLSHEEIGEVLGCSVPTVKRDWRRARIWLHDFMQSG